MQGAQGDGGMTLKNTLRLIDIYSRDEEDPNGSPLITVMPHTRANRVMDLETLSRAILNLHEGMEEKQARDTALHVLEFFGYNDYAYANALARTTILCSITWKILVFSRRRRRRYSS